jgi:hypothetical protein
MVGWLIRDVLLDPVELGWADAECSVGTPSRATTARVGNPAKAPFLPRKEAIGFSHPSAGVGLQGSHRIRQRHIRRED